jgi:hypothetical protein
MSVWGIQVGAALTHVGVGEVNVGAALTHVGVGKSGRCSLSPCRYGENRSVRLEIIISAIKIAMLTNVQS